MIRRQEAIKLCCRIALQWMLLVAGSSIGLADLQIGSPLLAPGSCVRPGKTCLIQVLITNPDARAYEGFLEFQLEGFPLDNYSHPFRMEPQSERRLSLPFLVPSTVKLGSKVEAKLRIELLENGQRIASVKAGERVFQTMPLSVEPDFNVTLGLFGKVRPEILSWEWREDPRNYLYEIAIAGRVQNAMTRRMMNIADQPLPLEANVWDAIDTVILADGSYLEDAAGLAALQSWVMRGGRLWLMLDRIHSDRVSSLLGPALQIHVVDRIEMLDVAVRTTDPVKVGEADLNYRVSSPVTLTRTQLNGFEVTHWANGWPAVAWARLGRGEIAVTTLDARSWLVPTAPDITQEQLDEMAKQSVAAEGAPPSERRVVAGRNPDRSSDFTLRPWVGNFTRRIYDQQRITPVQKIIDAAVADQIGLPVISKTWVFSLLIGFLLTMAVALWLLTRFRRLEAIGWIAPHDFSPRRFALDRGGQFDTA